jgi:hypothetical protein
MCMCRSRRRPCCTAGCLIGKRRGQRCTALGLSQRTCGGKFVLPCYVMPGHMSSFLKQAVANWDALTMNPYADRALADGGWRQPVSAEQVQQHIVYSLDAMHLYVHQVCHEHAVGI